MTEGEEFRHSEGTYGLFVIPRERQRPRNLSEVGRDSSLRSE
jgi:hypothetical protein